MDDDLLASETTDDSLSPDALLFRLSQFFRQYQKGMYRARLPFVPHRGQNRVLHMIAEHDGLNQKELADLLDIRSASTSELLNKLERANRIVRERNEADKRIQQVFLSAEGRAEVERSQAQNDFAQMLFGSLSKEERHSFDAVLKKLIAVFEVQQLLEEDEPGEPLPPHLREGHLPPPPPIGAPPPPHKKR